jgi:trimethylamine--corrinoid protein Co-methyltransferase
MKLRCRVPQVLTEDECEKIWQAALRVWAKVPLRAQGTPEFCDALMSLGCRVEGDRVWFLEKARDAVLTRIEESRRSRPTSQEPDFSPKLTYGTSGQALWCHDPYTDKLRPATEKDLADFSRVVDALGLPRYHPTFIPQDVPAATADVHAFATIMLNASRPHRVSVYSEKNLPYFIEMQAIIDGSVEKVRENPVFAAKVWYNSPFMITEENIRVGMKARELLEQPLQISTMPVAGVATPATLAGALVQMTAEVLGCNAITIAVDDRLCGYCAGPLTFDMKTGIHTQTGPDVQLLRLGAAQMGAYVFGGHYTAVGGPTTAAKVPGPQSMMEKSLDTMWAVVGGVRDFGSMSVLAFADVGSVVQLMLDLEMMRHFERLLEGIQVDDERLAEEVILEVAPRGAYYLEHDHTFRHYKDELFVSELMDRRAPMAWAANPATMLDNARAKAIRLLEAAPNLCPLTEEQRAEIKRIVATADRQADGTRRTK